MIPNLDLMRTNAGSSKVREKKRWLIVGSCVIDENPELLSKINADVIMRVCLETIHMNMVETKIIAMVQLSRPDSIAVLTKDGSPHCVQLHYVLEDLRKYTKHDVKIEHYVIYKGKLKKISDESVKLSRYLSKIESRLVYTNRTQKSS